MSNILDFEFEELPLAIVKGIPAGLINGMAEIRYNREGGWGVESVCLEGYQTLTPEERARGARPWIYVAAPSGIADIVTERLHTDWHDRVVEAVRELLASDREDYLDMRRDARRDDAMGL